MTGGPRIDGYAWAGGHEAMLRFGPDEGPVVVAALPLFEEANRTRAFVVAILRALAARGIGSVLPDVPGQGESLVALDATSLADMRTAFGAASRHACRGKRRGYAVTVRSGALLDGDASLGGRWHLSPQDGTSLVRELSRIKQADHVSGRAEWNAGHEDGTPVEIAGNLIAAAFLRDLNEASLIRDRTVRLASEVASADLKIDGAPLWRRSEPGTDTTLSQRLADDIAEWIVTCEG